MNLTVNGKTDEILKDELTLIDLLKEKDVEMPDMVSVQLNGEFVKRDNFETTNINNGDKVDFLYFMGGGK